MELPFSVTKDHAAALKLLFGPPLMVMEDQENGSVITDWTYEGDLPTQAEAEAMVADAAQNRIRGVRQPFIDQSDQIALRCFKAGVAFPEDWKFFTQALRDWPQTPTSPMPAVPAIPEGI